MRRSQMEFLIVGVAVLALAAGVAGGLLASRLPWVFSKPARPADNAPLTEALSLTPDQREKMRGIWESVRADVRDTYEEARALERKRDQAYISLLTAEQKAQYEKISQELAVEFDSLSHRRDELFQQAVVETKKLLSDAQRAKYEEILRARGPAGLDGPRGAGGPVGAGLDLSNDLIDKNGQFHGRTRRAGSS